MTHYTTPEPESTQKAPPVRGFDKMYREIRRRSDLSSDCKILFCMVANFCNMGGGCTASNAKLAAEMGATDDELKKKSAQRNIQRWLGQLEAAGLVKIRHLDDNIHKARTVTVTGRYDSPVAPDGKPDKGCDKKQREYDAADARVRHQDAKRYDTGVTQKELLEEELKEELKEELREEAAKPPAPAARPVFSSSFQETEKAEEKETAVVTLPETPTLGHLQAEVRRVGYAPVWDRAVVEVLRAGKEGMAMGYTFGEWLALKNRLQQLHGMAGQRGLR